MQMRHCIVCSPDEFVDDTYAVSTDMASIGDALYATTPMPAFRPVFQQPNEEELYTSFEEAISDRVLAVNRRLSHLSRAHSHVRQSVAHGRQQSRPSPYQKRVHSRVRQSVAHVEC